MNLGKINESKKLQKSNRYAAVFFVIVIGLLVLSSIFLTFDYVSGSSMEHTLHDGDLEICLRSNFYSLKPGDIVNINSSALDEKIVKRIIALENDVIRSENGELYVNNQLIDEYYLGSDFNDTFEICVPHDCVFVMGDNRGISRDSRSEEVGCIPVSEIKSKLLFSLSKEEKIR